MKFSKEIPPTVIAAAAGMLQTFIPGLSPQGLIAALKEFQEKGNDTIKSEKPLTRREAAALLSVSLNTINRYMNMGALRRIPLTPRSVRIDPQSIRNLLTRCGEKPEEC